MVKRIGRFRRKTRSKLRKSIRKKGKISIKDYVQSFKPGDRICLKAEPAVQKGMYFPRFHAKTGIVKAKIGRCYSIMIKEKNKIKTIIVHPVHLKKCQT